MQHRIVVLLLLTQRCSTERI